MHKKILALAAAALIVGALAGCSGSSSGSASTSATSTGSTSAAASATSTTSASASTPKTATLQDIVSESRVFQTLDETWGVEYILVYAGKDTGALTSVLDIVQLYKSAGYTLDYAKDFNPDEVYPGFSTFDFASMEVEEKSTLKHGDVIQITLKFSSLKNNEHLRALDASGILTLDKKDADWVTSDSVCDVVKNNGGVEIDKSEIVGLGLPLL